MNNVVESIKKLTAALKSLEKVVWEKTEFLNSINHAYFSSPTFQKELQIESNFQEIADFQNTKNQVSIHTSLN